VQSAIQGDPYDGQADLTSSALSASLRQFDSPSLWRRARPLVRDGGDVDGDGVVEVRGARRVTRCSHSARLLSLTNNDDERPT